MDKCLKYFKGDEFRASTWKNKYALKNDEGITIEESPLDMFRRLAREFARIESNYIWIENNKNNNWIGLSEYGYKRRDLTEEAIYNLLLDFRYIIIAGSGMATIGSGKPVSASNCFVIGSPKDSITEINKTSTEQQNLMKRRGGVGHDLSNIRPRGTIVNNSANTSSGVVPFMNLYSEATNTIAQEGRRGALMLSISINHPDSPEFIKSKQDLTKITGANISVKVTDEFMNAVLNNDDYYLRFPVNMEVDHVIIPEGIAYNKLIRHKKGYIKKVKARELWNNLMFCAWNTAEPGILFEDNIVNYSPDGLYDRFKFISTNPCFRGDMKLLTNDGYKTFSSLNNQNDLKLINKDGEIVKGKVWSNGIKDVYEVKTWNNTSLFCTKDHRFLTIDGEEKEIKDCVGLRIMPYFKLNQNVDLYTKLGFIQGDGNLSRLNSESHKGLEINIGKKDKEIDVLFNANLKDTERKLYTDEYTDVLKELGFKAKTLPERTLPSTINEWDKDEIASFLKGLWSANGSVIKNHRISFKTTCLDLVLELQKILIDLFGIDSYYTTNKPKNVEFDNGEYLCKESYDLNINKLDSVIKFANNIAFVHKYKNESLIELIKTKAPKIRSVKHVSSEEVFDFNLEDNTHWGVVEGLIAHNCGEITMGSYDSCRLIHLNLTSFIVDAFTDKATIDEDLLYRISYEITRLGDDLIDLELEAIDRILEKVTKDNDQNEIELWNKIKSNTEDGRRAGIGFTGLSDAIAMLGMKFDSNESIHTIDYIMKIMMAGQLDAQIDMAITRGAFSDWNKTIELLGNDWFDHVKKTYPLKYEKMMKYGRRNISFSTVAPTGTVSIMAGTSSGIEPVFLPYYQRFRKCMTDEDRVDHIDAVGEKYTAFVILHPMFEQWATSIFNEDTSVWDMTQWEEAYEQSPWYESIAPDIDWKKRVEIQGVVQKYITHSISSTINLDANTTLEEVADIYIEAWKKGNKGQTIYRDGCRDGVLNAIDSSSKKETNNVECCEAPKRPHELEADYYQMKIKGELFSIVIGLYEGRPYEIFAFKPKINVKIEPHKGIIEKVEKNHYRFYSDKLEIENLELTSESEIERSTTLSSSMLLRHGVGLKYIIKTISKINPVISSFSSAICRILRRYQDNEISSDSCPECGGKLLHENGCVRCLDCDYSKCL